MALAIDYLPMIVASVADRGWPSPMSMAASVSPLSAAPALSLANLAPHPSQAPSLCTSIHSWLLLYIILYVRVKI